MLNRKTALTVTGVLILVTLALFLLSHQTPPETVVTYKAVTFSPKTETKTESASHPNSDVEMGDFANEVIDVSEPETEDYIESTETAQRLDELFFDEILEDTETDTHVVRVSPYGFGAYPEIPPGAPIAPFEESDSLNMELLGRVMVKKWNEGYAFTGGMIESQTGKVYLNYTDVLYVSWEDEVSEENTRSLTRVAGGGNVKLTPEEMEKGQVPSGYTIIDFESAGIDPYKYLDLPE